MPCNSLMRDKCACVSPYSLSFSVTSRGGFAVTCWIIPTKYVCSAVVRKTLRLLPQIPISVRNNVYSSVSLKWRLIKKIWKIPQQFSGRRLRNKTRNFSRYIARSFVKVPENISPQNIWVFQYFHEMYKIMY